MNFKNSIVYICFALLISSCTNKNASIQPEIRNITESVYASGIIKSQSQYQVFSKSIGILQTSFVKEGDLVKKGDALFQLNNDNARLTTDNARLAAANSDYTNNLNKLEDLKNVISVARKKFSTDSLLLVRQRNLWESKIGTKIELEQRELSFENSKTNLASAIINYDDLQKQLKLLSGQSQNNLLISKTFESDFLIKSEVDGKVYSINKEQNELVTTQQPIAIIGDAEVFLVELNVDEHDIVKIKTGQQVLIRMDSYKGEVFEGIISSIDQMMNERTRTFKAEATFVKKPAMLYPNLTVEANVVIRTKQNALTIPRNYLVNDSMVMIEDGELQKVTTGLIDYNLVEITDGITGTSKIILPEK
jgi:HlyD family secretion protein